MMRVARTSYPIPPYCMRGPDKGDLIRYRPLQRAEVGTRRAREVPTMRGSTGLIDMGRRIEQHPPPAQGTPRKAGFAALAFEQFHLGLHRYLLRRLHSVETAEDLA